MEDWLSYRVRDFIMLSPEAYVAVLQDMVVQNPWMSPLGLALICLTVWNSDPIGLTKDAKHRGIVALILLAHGYLFLQSNLSQLTWVAKHLTLLLLLCLLTMLVSAYVGRNHAKAEPISKPGLWTIVLLLVTLFPWEMLLFEDSGIICGPIASPISLATYCILTLARLKRDVWLWIAMLGLGLYLIVFAILYQQLAMGY
ncbi:MAG: hypothetical protein HRU19_16470 [Pseudobacteriovorax sp.]|nr:hypothetical protein [Pseudobacteriovorax sp.]